MSGRDANQRECGHDEQFDCPKCRDPKEWPQLAPMPERDANQLEADVRRALSCTHAYAADQSCRGCPAGAALNELVGLVGALQQHDHLQLIEIRELKVALAEMTADRDRLILVSEAHYDRIGRLRDALATTRQALAAIESSESYAGHDLPEYIARRALADTGGDTAYCEGCGMEDCICVGDADEAVT